ncbi:Replication protein O [Nostoc flagelliforme CCNUN1]|uniref:Replication protein O n=1 Tax=Nostoc flagelliforme CCNUN1 TaxID=2038116 RepID=A0A2K8SJH7_9NOSO|nr:Replication protein O [Nostoc flagelliforme CCNUN1]
MRTWKGIKSPESVFVAACKEGRKPEAQQTKSGVIAWFEWARKNRIVTLFCHSRKTIIEARV